MNTTDEYDVGDIARFVFISIGSLEVVSGVAGNCLLLTVLIPGIRSLGMRSSHHYFLINLTLSDLVTLGYWLPFFVLDLILGKHPVENDTFCKANGFIIAVCLATGVLSLTFISLNRYLHVCHNHLYRRVCTRGRTIACCVCQWVFSSLLALPPLVNVGAYGYSNTTHICIYRWENDTYPKVMIVIFVVGSMSLVGFLNYGIFRYWKMGRLKMSIKYPLIRENQEKRDNMLEIMTDDRGVHTLNSKILSEQKAVLTARTDQTETPTEVNIDQSETSTGFGMDQSETTTSESQEEDEESGASDEETIMSDKTGLGKQQDTQPLGIQPVRPLGNRHADNDLHEQYLQPHRAYRDDNRVVVKADGSNDDPQASIQVCTPARGPSLAGCRQLSRRCRKEVPGDKAFVRSLCVVFFLMLFCFFPFGIAAVVDSFGALPTNMAIACNLILFLNSAVNWIVYGVMNRSFRRGYVTHVRRVVRVCWPRLFARLHEKRMNSRKGTIRSRST